jgi:hypothetical protein
MAALGYTLQLPQEDRFLMLEDELPTAGYANEKSNTRSTMPIRSANYVDR